MIGAGNPRRGSCLSLLAALTACAALTLPAPGADARAIYVDAPDPGGRENAIVPVPPPGKRFFGFHENTIIDTGPGQWSASDAAAIADGAGANVFRLTLDWMLVEPAPDTWDNGQWMRITNAYNALLAAGIKPIITVSTAPKWAREAGGPQACEGIRGCEFPPRPEMLGEWRELFSEIASRYPGLAAVEIWNEPNLTSFYKPHPQPRYYARLVAQAYAGVRAVTDDIAVLAGSLAPAQTTHHNPSGTVLRWAADQFLARAYRARPSLRGKADGISYHHSTQDRRYGAGSLFAAVTRDVRRVRNRYDRKRLPLWITEFGLSTTGGGGVTARTQARSLVRAYRRAMTMRDVRGFIIHALRNRTELAPTDRAYGFGVIADWDPFQPKRAYCAFAGRAAPANPYGGCKPVRERIRIARCARRVLELELAAKRAKGAKRKRLARKADRLERRCLPCRKRIAKTRAELRGAKGATRKRLERRLRKLRAECGSCVKRAERLRTRYARSLVTERLDYRIRYERNRRRCKP